MEKTERQRKALDVVGSGGGCVLAERSDLSFIATEGGEQATWEVKRTARR
jgi:hypothetical protein